MEYKVQVLNKIAPEGIRTFPPRYRLALENSKRTFKDPDAVLLRSADLTGFNPTNNPSLLAVARAGTGVNNIPVEEMTKHGIAVFNTPGANTNSVKELVIAGMLMATRNLQEAIYNVDNHLRQQGSSQELMDMDIELMKSVFKGRELTGRTIGIVGLGNIGSAVAHACVGMGMRVVGYDQYLTVEKAWKLPSEMSAAISVEELYAWSDFVTVHVPLTIETKNMIDEEAISRMKDGVIILNFARAGIINEDAICNALESGKVHTYVSDFPRTWFTNFGPRRIIAFPHLGAATENAEARCAKMAADELIEYLDNGNIHNSVNFPEIDLPRGKNDGYRISVIHSNTPNMLASISTTLGQNHVNINDMLNKSKDDIAYTLMDLENFPPERILDSLRSIPGVIKLRYLG